jgi:hypothetical protein
MVNMMMERRPKERTTRLMPTWPICMGPGGGGCLVAGTGATGSGAPGGRAAALCALLHATAPLKVRRAAGGMVGARTAAPTMPVSSSATE